MVSDPLPTCYGVALQRAMHTYLNFACIFWNPSLRSEIPRCHAKVTRSRPSNAVWGAGPGNDSRITLVTVLGTRPSLFPLLNGFRELTEKPAKLAEPGPFCSTPAQACIARMFVWVLERGKCEGGLHGEFSACVFGWAQATSCCGSCVCAFDTASKHPVTFLNRHVAAVCGVVAREERANWRL